MFAGSETRRASAESDLLSSERRSQKEKEEDSRSPSLDVLRFPSSALLVEALGVIPPSYPGRMRGVMKKKSSSDFVLTCVCLKRLPIIGSEPTNGTSLICVCWLVTYMPPRTTVAPSFTVTLVSTDCVVIAGMPWTYGIPLSI